MKPLLVLARITFVGCLWSILFIEGIRVIMLENWRFDIFWPPHWAYAWSLWQAGWVIDTPKEWAFILILLAFIPLWLTGWIALSLIPWEGIVFKIVSWPLRFIKGSVEPLAQVVGGNTPVVTKKKSYKEIRPAGKRVPIYDYNAPAPVVPSPVLTPSTPTSVSISTSSAYKSNPVKDRAVSARETLNHAIFDLDDEDDDFDLDIDSFDKTDIFKIDSNKKKQENKFDDDYEAPRRSSVKSDRRSSKFDLEDEEDDDDIETYAPVLPKRKTSSRSRFEEENFSRKDAHSRSQMREKSQKPERSAKSGGAIGDILEEKGYDVFRNIQLKRAMVDYIAVSSDKLLLMLVDKESGDWLADEERFNDEEPLWFSESSHRISPVRKIDLVRERVEKELKYFDLDLEVKPYVIIIAGNIINAEDMIDIWSDMEVSVVRFAKGSPTDLLPLSKAIDRADDTLSESQLAEFKKLIKKLA
ncbi:MAG: hypothetical protein IJ870_04270 [Alphaproteobacteria bacterium]|nr:hypothetical protein [Alphaproteobacteria bacterium]